MSLHKLTAGDGYTYLTRQVAAADDTHRGRASLGEYYEQNGESPGVWLGAGLASLAGDLPESVVTGVVTEDQMVALFGLGRHPNDLAIVRQLARDGVSRRAQDAATKLGHAYHVYEPNPFLVALDERLDAERSRRAGAGDQSPWAVVRSKIRTELAREWFAAEHGRAPVDEREFISYLVRVSRPAKQAVAGFDVTFSPVKSVSALWAIADRDAARQIAACHDEAVRETVAWLEKHATYTRRGTDGVAQVDTTGLIAAAFTHRDSRAGDPDLHTHVAVSNKVCTPDGRWLSLDGRALYRNKLAASEHYNTRLEALLTEQVGVVFAERGDAAEGKRDVREIAGLPRELLRLWSSRRADIEAATDDLARTFRVDHGRPPTERLELAQQATLATREGKHAPRAEADQRRVWRGEAASALGGDDAVDALVRQVTAHVPVAADPVGVDGLARQVLAVVGAERAVWQEHHLRAEAERLWRGRGGVPELLVDETAQRALDLSVLLSLPPEVDEPAVLRRADGSSVYEVAGSRRYTSAAVLDAERRILSAAGRTDGHVAASERVDVALLEAVANGIPLGADQAAMARELTASGARVQLALAPAGCGKTATLRVVANAWAGDGNEVIGLAPTAAAARVLREELGDVVVATDTLAKLAHAVSTGTSVPDWVDRIGAGSLLIVDEAGMAGTPDLATVIDFAVERGASVRLVGDDRQLAAVGAGGVLRDLDRTFGSVTLTEVRRFTHADGSSNAAEAAASLALRRGDPAALGYYLDHGRIHDGDTAACVDDAFAAWAADRTAGRDTLLIASTNQAVLELNLRAQAARRGAAAVPADRCVTLADGTRAGDGDVVITRRNDRRLTLSATDFVANGDRWTVTSVRSDGGLDVRHLASHRTVTLPADYVAEHVQLGYACTVHAAQGATVDTAHAVLTGSESRQLLYVAMTRGRQANHIYVDTAGALTDDAAAWSETAQTPTAVEVLSRVIERDDATVSATTARREERDPHRLLAKACAEYKDALNVAAESILEADGLADIAARAEATVRGITDWPAWPALSLQLQQLALNDQDAMRVLHEQAMTIGTSETRDVAAVLAVRIDAWQPDAGPLPWLPAVPRAVVDDDFWGRYFNRRVELIQRHGDAVRAEATSWTCGSAPAWAAATLSDPALLRDLAVWRAAHSVADSDPRPTGDEQTSHRDKLAQLRLDRRITDTGGLAGRPGAGTARWAEELHPGITRDPHWRGLAQQIASAEQVGLDRAEIARLASTRPLPIEHPAAALAYRLVDATKDRAAVESAEAAMPNAAAPRRSASDGSIPLPTTEPHHRPTAARAQPRPYEPPRIPAPPPYRPSAPPVQRGPRR